MKKKINNDEYTFKYEEIKKNEILVACKISEVFKNNKLVKLIDLDTDITDKLIFDLNNFSHSKHHYIPRVVLSNWQTNTTKNHKNKNANSYIFNFKNGSIENENFNIYEGMQAIKHYTKIIDDYSLYTLEGCFINNISEKHIQKIMNMDTDISFSSNHSIDDLTFYEILSSLYYINNRGSNAFFNNLFDLIINSNNFLGDYKKFIAKNFDEFYKKSIFGNSNFFVHVVNFEENFLFLNNFWGTMYKLSKNTQDESFFHIVPLKQNKAIIVSNLENVKNEIISKKHFIQELIIKDTMYLAEKENIKSVVLIGNNKYIVDNYLNTWTEQSKHHISNIFFKIIENIKLNNKYRLITNTKNYLKNPYELDDNSDLYLCYTNRGLFESKIENVEFRNNSIEINSIYKDKFRNKFKISNYFY